MRSLESKKRGKIKNESSAIAKKKKKKKKKCSGLVLSEIPLLPVGRRSSKNQGLYLPRKAEGRTVHRREGATTDDTKTAAYAQRKQQK